MTTYTMRPLRGHEVIFELVDDGGEVVAIGYEGPLRLIAAPPERCDDLECHGECRTHDTERDV